MYVKLYEENFMQCKLSTFLVKYNVTKKNICLNFVPQSNLRSDEVAI